MPRSVSAALARGDYSRLSPYSALFVDLDEGLRVNISATWVRETRKSALPFEPLVANVRTSVAGALEAAVAAAATDSDAATATSVPVFRVGLISRRFESYAGTQLLLALPRALRRSSVHVTCFASGPDDHSLERETLRRDCDDFVDLSLATVEAGFQMVRRWGESKVVWEAEEWGSGTTAWSYSPTDGRTALLSQIAERGVNVLVDYDGLHEFNNLKTLALRPSPTQLSFLGFAGPINPSRPGKRNLSRATRATGSPGPEASVQPIVDGLLVDPVVVPPETLARTYADRLVYLPRTYQPQDPETYTRLVRALAESVREAAAGALTAEAWSSVVQANRTQLLGADRSSWTVFAAFNRVAKIEPMIWATWMQVLRRTPRSVLWLYRDEDEPVERLLAEAEAQGVPRSRILVAPKVPKAEHLARHALADVFLDTRVYGAHTSASDALTSGLPVVTTPGASFASRVGASLARAAHSAHTVTASLRDYEALSARLGRQRDTLAFSLRRQILEQNLLAPRALQARHPALFHIDAFANEWLAATRAAGELRAHDWGHLVLPANQPQR